MSIDPYFDLSGKIALVTGRRSCGSAQSNRWSSAAIA